MNWRVMAVTVMAAVAAGCGDGGGQADRPVRTHGRIGSTDFQTQGPPAHELCFCVFLMFALPSLPGWGAQLVHSGFAPSGYVTLFHYGCTTGVAQVNDTDLHAELERVYCELEQAAFNEQQLYEPGFTGGPAGRGVAQGRRSTAGS